MLKVKETIIVEGKYDKNTLSQLIDATIIETSGFGIFTDNEKISLIRKLAEKTGIIIFTDGDGAGFMIRNHLKGILQSDNIKHAYIPDVKGKERRKRAASKEGKLGVEGMTGDVLINALRIAGATFEDFTPDKKITSITKAELYSLGLLGTDGSAERRRALAIKLGLPERISSNSLLEVLNALYSPEELRNLL